MYGTARTQMVEAEITGIWNAIPSAACTIKGVRVISESLFAEPIDAVDPLQTVQTSPSFADLSRRLREAATEMYDTYYAGVAMARACAERPGIALRRGTPDGGSSLIAVVTTQPDLRAVLRRLREDDRRDREKMLADEAAADPKTLYRTFHRAADGTGVWGRPARTRRVAESSLASTRPEDSQRAIHTYRFHRGWGVWVGAHAPRGCSGTGSFRSALPSYQDYSSVDGQ